MAMWGPSPSQETTAEVREGFLCPICMLDLGTIVNLQFHYDEAHSNEDRAVLQSFKDLIDKAKRKLMTKNDDNSGGGEAGLSSDDSCCYIPGIDTSSWDAQELGATKSHTDFFKAIRNNRTDYYVLETNKLLIRLDKLVTDSPSDPVKRKAHEQSVVEWLSDQFVPLCPDCTRRFTLTRRKHHCRLCGGVMCAQCSHFITHTYAKSLTSPVDAHAGSSSHKSVRERSSFDTAGRSWTISANNPTGFPSFSLSRSGSASSLNSIGNTSGEAHIRLCVKCRKLLDRRDEVIEQHNSKPVITQFYDKLRSCLNECNEFIPLYLKMADSLLSGENNYSLRDAQDVRIKLIKLAESIDLLSKKILTLGMNEEVKPNARTMQLQRGIYLSANTFLKDRMLGLPSLPSEKELADMQEERKRQWQARIAHEKMAALELQNRAIAQREPSPNRKQQQQQRHQKQQQQQRRPTTIGGDLRSSVATAVSLDDGWAATSFGGDDDVSDPLVQQMDIIRSYVEQARRAYKFDEVQMLEANLKELQDEFRRQQQMDKEDDFAPPDVRS